MPKILLLGKDGQVGWELARRLPAIGQVIALGRNELDLRQLDVLAERLNSAKPDVIINAAAYTDVDGAETERDLTYTINAEAPRIMAERAQALGALLIHYSTDYVFDGEKETPYTEGDAPHPINHYGQTKLEGEQAIAESGGSYWVLRTSWVYSARRPCFVTKVLAWARERKTLRLADDQRGSPTWCRVVASATQAAIERSFERGRAWAASTTGVYHLACAGSPSRLEWAKAILAHDPHPEEQVAVDIVGVPAGSFQTAAERPRNSALDSRRFTGAFDIEMPMWERSLARAMRSG